MLRLLSLLLFKSFFLLRRVTTESEQVDVSITFTGADDVDNDDDAEPAAFDAQESKMCGRIFSKFSFMRVLYDNERMVGGFYKVLGIHVFL